MGKFIAVIDYGLGNLRSVSKALEAVGAATKVTCAAKDLKNASAIVLPGVGAFQTAMKNLAKLEVVPTLLKEIKKGKPFLGICLGLQILFSESEEHGKHAGLNIVPGKVKRFGPGLKIPHMGWNAVSFKKDTSKLKLFRGIPEDSYFYFVHSYYVEPKDKKAIAATTSYGKEFTSVINLENIWGMQFHPEKSETLGLKVLENFCRDVN